MSKKGYPDPDPNPDLAVTASTPKAHSEPDLNSFQPTFESANLPMQQ